MKRSRDGARQARRSTESNSNHQLGQGGSTERTENSVQQPHDFGESHGAIRYEAYEPDALDVEFSNDNPTVYGLPTYFHLPHNDPTQPNPNQTDYGLRFSDLQWSAYHPSSPYSTVRRSEGTPQTYGYPHPMQPPQICPRRSATLQHDQISTPSAGSLPQPRPKRSVRSNARSQSFRTGKTDQWAPPPPFAVPQSAAGGTNDWSGAPSARLREALDGQEHGALCDLIREKVHLQCEDEYAWIEELVELGYSDQGIADLLLEQKRESPWIRYKQLDLDIPVSPHFHLPGCVHQGGIEQVLALGILSYSNAHIGPLQPFYLERSLANITLAGTGYGSEKPITVDLANLACMGKMLGEPVMVFGWGPGLKWGSVDAYKLLASPEDLVDTWGPGRFVIDRHAPENEKLQAIEIGGGTILRTEDPSQFHWGQQPWVPDSTGRGFSSTEKIIIAGQPERNAACLLDHGRISHQSEAFLHRLGPVPEIWQLAERQFGLQVGQYGVAQFNATWKKRKSVTLKDMWLDEPNMSLSFLESYWGIQVSLCTGIAQRVPLRELIADVMEAFIGDRAQKPLKWDSLLQTHGILDRFRPQSRM
ncbi:hypothetical protein H2203_005327 [Taxawa tesnikishii (nom. ined.)]|nr:hypothetical protein H2203_005327 [Dothideales sp. JES 119]